MSLSEAFGFRVPEVFVTIVQTLYDLCESEDKRWTDLFSTVFGIYPVGEDMRYQQTPPELFPFGAMGVDGVHYGCVIHAPELEAEDYPVGDLCPMDDDASFADATRGKHLRT